MAITVHNSGAFTGTTTAGSTFSGPLIRISGVEPFLVLCIGHRSNTGGLTSAFWQPAGTSTGQVALTFLGKKVHSSQTLTIEYWGLLAPATGSGNARVAFTHSQSVSASGFAVCLTGVDQTTPYAGYGTGDSHATNLDTNTAEGSTTATTTYTTTMASLTVAANQMVVQVAGWGVSALSETMLPATSHEWIGSRVGATLQTTVQVAKPAAGSFSSNASLGNNTALAVLPWVVGGLLLNSSTTNAPYAVTPPQAATTASPTASPMAVTATTTAGNVFNTTNTPSIAYGAFVQQAVTQNLPLRASSVGANSITYTGTQPGTTGLGSRVQELSGWGDGAPAASAVATQVFVLPSTIALNDIVIVNVHGEAIGAATIAAGTWTSITSVDSTALRGTAFRQQAFWHRVVADDLVNEAGRTFTITPSANTRLYCTVQVFRNCITSGSPVDASATTTGNTTASTQVTGATVTTTDVNRGIVHCFANNVPAAATITQGGTWTRRGNYYGLIFGDSQQAAAGVSGFAQVLSGGAFDWTEIVLALIPASGSTTYNPTFLNTLPAMWAAARAALTRQMNFDPTLTVSAQWAASNASLAHTETLNPTLSVAAQWAGARAVLTTVVNYHRTLSGGPFWVTNSAALTRQVTFDPTLSPVQQWAVGRASVNGVKQGVTTYNPTFLNTLPAFWAVGRAVLTRQMNFSRTLTVTFQWAGSRAVLTRQAAFSRTLTVTAAWASARAVLTTGTNSYHPTLTVTAQWAASRATVTGIKQSATAGLPFGTLPLLWLYTASNYVNCGIYFEAQLKSGDGNAVAGQLSDVTGVANPAATGVGTLVVVSQVSTSAPHTTLQRVRSADITSALTDGHVYRAEMNKLASTVPMTMSTAFIDPVEN